MPIVPDSQTTSNLLGKGSHVRFSSNQLDRAGRGLNRGTKHMVLLWSLEDAEVITPGSGGVPPGVLGMAWQANAASDPGSVFFNTSTGVGTAYVTSGPHTGRLHIWSRRR